MEQKDREWVKFEAGLFPSEEFEDSDAIVKIHVDPFIRSGRLANLLFGRLWAKNPRGFLKCALIGCAVVAAGVILFLSIVSN